MTVEEAITAAVDKAIEPLIAEIRELKAIVNGDYHKYPTALRVKEIAAIMGVSMDLARGLCETDNFPVHRVRGRIVIPRDAFFKWFNFEGQK